MLLDYALLLLLSFVSFSLGALLTWLAWRRSYLLPMQELRKEALEVRWLLNQGLAALENAGMAEVFRKEDGQIEGVILHLHKPQGDTTIWPPPKGPGVPNGGTRH